MQIKDYIQGNRRGKEANRFEREAMNDPFLQGAMDGFDSVAGDHAKIIEQLEADFTNPKLVPLRKKRKFLYWVAVAASVLILIGIGAYFLLEINTRDFPSLPESQHEEMIVTPADSSISVESEEANKSPLESSLASKEYNPSLDASSEVAGRPRTDTLGMHSKGASLSAKNATASDTHPGSPEAPVMKEGLENSTLSEPEAQTNREKVAEETDATSGSKENESIRSSFGEKEFQAWCQQKADKNVCGGKSAMVKVSFFIDETGKPSSVEYKKFSCDDARKIIANLLPSSPVWTTTNRKVTVTVKW